MKKLILLLCFCSCSFLFAQTAFDLFSRGQQFQENEDWMSAIESYQEALSINPSYGQAWFALAESSYALGEYPLALQYAETAQRYLQNDSALKNLKGFIFIGLGKIQDAKAIFLDVLNRYPNDIDARFGLAELELFSGKKTSAESYFKEALARQGENKKALLSLALLSYDMGNTNAAKDFIQRALRYHSGESNVHYFASYLAVQDGDLLLAEKHAKNALLLNPRDKKSLHLLSLILYSQKKYGEAIVQLNALASLDNKNAFPWYVKAKIAEKEGKIEDALRFYQNSLERNPEDEISRSAMEILITKYLLLEDGRRKTWASHHIKKAKEARMLFLSEDASYEYKRALKINPFDTDTRLSYAELLLQEGKAESYYAQLEFIENEGVHNQVLSDLLESYASLLRSSLSQKWKTNPIFLDKKRYSLSLYFIDAGVQILHPDALSVTSQMLKDTAEMQGLLEVNASSEPVFSYAEAFRKARETGSDYFALLRFEETEREMLSVLSLYNAKTGTKIQDFSVYRTGNARYTQIIQKLVSQLTKALPLRGKIIARSGYSALIDLGKFDGLTKETHITIVEKGKLSLDNDMLRLFASESSILGTLSLEEINEGLSEGRVRHNGFFDKIAVGDEVFIAQENNADKAALTASQNMPVLVDLLRSIR